MFLLQKAIRWLKYLGRRRCRCILLLVVWTALLFAALSWSDDVARALEPPPPPDQNLNHFKTNTDLRLYLDVIQVLVEPSWPCPERVPLLVLVSSSPQHEEQRHAIRATWGDHQPTIFVLGLHGQDIDENMVDNYMEAKQFGDMIIFDMPDHYQNLTLKTVLMLKWTLDRCPQAERVFKTDDDVLVNPWTLNTLLEEHKDAEFLGYAVNNSQVHRDAYNKWFVPRWLLARDLIPHYLSGTGYILQGKYVRSILEAAAETPLMNLEDVYLSHLVWARALRRQLAHDARLSPYRPWIPLDCAYWTLASLHSLKPSEMSHAWAKILRVADQYARDKSVCTFYRKYLESELLLY